MRLLPFSCGSKTSAEEILRQLKSEPRAARGRWARLAAVSFVTVACSSELQDPQGSKGSGAGSSGIADARAGAGAGPVGGGGTHGGTPSGEHEEAVVVGREFACDPSIPAQPASSLVIRLSANEYANSIRDLFGVNLREDALLLPDGLTTSREFNNLSSSVTRQHADKFAAMAEKVAAQIEPTKLLAEYGGGCRSYDAACTDALIGKLGSAVLRGPLAAVEKTAFAELMATGQAEEVPFDDAVRYLVEALLQAPRFIYRIETEVGDGKLRDLNPFELASRLSYMVWGSTPDAELRKLAESSQLTEVAVQAEQIARMLADPRAKEHALEFFDDWMDLHRTDDSSQVQTRHPDFDEGLLVDMRAETRAAFAHIFDNRLPIQALHNLQTTVLTDRLAKHYGVPVKTDGKYDLSAVPERGGLLTQGAMASLGGVESSTVRRGLHVLGEVLCGTIPDPPAGVDTTPTPATPSMSIRQSSETRVNGEVCGFCHRQFEPLIWGLVRFDVAGNYKTSDHYSNPLPEDGWVIFPDDPGKTHPYKTVKELTDILASSSRVRDCAALKFQKYVTRRDAVVGDGCSLKTVRDRLEQGTGSYQEIVTALALSPNFRKTSIQSAGGTL